MMGKGFRGREESADDHRKNGAAGRRAGHRRRQNSSEERFASNGAPAPSLEDLRQLEEAAVRAWRLGRFESLLQLTARLIRLNGREPGYYVLRGLACQGLGEFSRARRAFESAQLLAAGTPYRDVVRQYLSALDVWQAEVFLAWIKCDPTLRRLYAANPSATLQRLGFSLSSEDRFRKYVGASDESSSWRMGTAIN